MNSKLKFVSTFTEFTWPERRTQSDVKYVFPQFHLTGTYVHETTCDHLKKDAA